jgi:hypothetical protein
MGWADSRRVDRSANATIVHQKVARFGTAQTVQLVSVPEPATLTLLKAGTAALLLRARRTLRPGR